jgi:tRNA-dihydrouridine synthase 1
MIQNVNLPISVKIRLCTPPIDTIRLARLLEDAGAAHITLHARYPSAKHRRHGPAQLDFVRDLKNALQIPVISNGNVRSFEDVSKNLQDTGADGIMAGEAILKNP